MKMARETSDTGRLVLTTMTTVGSCLCGTVSFEIEGTFDSFFLCHCSRCRKDTGSAHAANLFATAAQLTWRSGEDRITTFRLPSTLHARSFCSICGSAVPGVQMDGKLLVVPAGCVDSELTMRPDAHLFVADRAAWDDALETVPQCQGLPSQPGTQT